MKDAVVVPEVKAVVVEKVAKPEIAGGDVKIAGVTVKVCKTCVIYTKGDRRAALKGRLLEVSEALKFLGDRLVTFTVKEIEARHLGSMKGSISPVKDNDDLSKILGNFFKGAKEKPVVVPVVKTAKPKAPKAKKTVKVAETPAPVVPEVPASETAVA